MHSVSIPEAYRVHAAAGNAPGHSKLPVQQRCPLTGNLPALPVCGASSLALTALMRLISTNLQSAVLLRIAMQALTATQHLS